MQAARISTTHLICMPSSWQNWVSQRRLTAAVTTTAERCKESNQNCLSVLSSVTSHRDWPNPGALRVVIHRNARLPARLNQGFRHIPHCPQGSLGKLAESRVAMTRTKSLLQLARSASKCNAAELSSFVPSRLLSNSQASTSAASDSAGPGGPSAGRRNPRQSDTANQRLAFGSQSGSRSESRGTSRAPTEGRRGDPGSFASSPTSDQTSRDFNQSEASSASAEPAVGYVEDGAYPYAASEVEITNLAPSTETAWEFLGTVDEQAVTWFGMDFTRGTLPEVERNALLSNEAKEMMYQMHKHDSER